MSCFFCHILNTYNYVKSCHICVRGPVTLYHTPPRPFSQLSNSDSPTQDNASLVTNQTTNVNPNPITAR